MDIAIFLACIIGAIYVLYYFGRYVWPHIFKAWLKKQESKDMVCEKCKGIVLEGKEILRLLPVRFDEKHERTVDYYIHSTVGINDLSQVPTGRRACRMVILQCQCCGYREVVVIDFLPVRGQEVLKNADVFPYEEFRRIFETI